MDFPCRQCGTPVEVGSPTCVSCGQKNPHTHPEINRFIRESFTHGLITDYTHGESELTGYGPRAFPAFPWVLTGALLSFGRGSLFPQAVGDAGTALLLGSLLWLAFGAVMGARKRFKIVFRDDAQNPDRKPKWSSNDNAYWREVREFFHLVPASGKLSARFARVRDTSWGGKVFALALILGIARLGMQLSKQPENPDQPPVARLEEALKPGASVGNLVEPEMFAKGLEQLRKRIPGQKPEPGSSPVSATALQDPKAPHLADRPIPTPTPRRIGTGGKLPPDPSGAPGAEDIPEDREFRPLPQKGFIDLAEYLIAEPGTTTWLAPEDSPGMGLIEIRSTLALTGSHTTERYDFTPSATAAAQEQETRVYQFTEEALRFSGWHRIGAGGRPVREELPRRLSRETQLPEGYRLEKFGEGLTVIWGQAGPCFEWSRPSLRAGSRWKETYCKGQGLMRLELRSVDKDTRVAAWMPRTRIHAEVLGSVPDFRALLPDRERARCDRGETHACRAYGIALELAGSPFDASSAYKKGCEARDAIACLALGDLESRVGSPRAAYIAHWRGCQLGLGAACRESGYVSLHSFGMLEVDHALPALRESCTRLDGFGCAILARLEERRKAPDRAALAHRRACGLGVTASCYRVSPLDREQAVLLPQFPLGAGALSF